MIRRSLYLKLMAVFILTGIAVNIVIAISFRGLLFNDPARRIAQRHIGNYLAHLVEDFGRPPRADRIERFMKDERVDVRIEDRHGTVLFGSEMPSIKELEPHVMRRGPWQRPVGNYYGQFFLIYEDRGVRYVFLLPKELGVEVDQTGVIILLVGVTVILLSAFFVLRRMLNREFKARVEESLSAKEQLLRDVSHELRSPQTRMRVALALLPDSSAKGAIADDLTELERMTQLILESARFDGSTKPKAAVEIDLSTMVSELAQTFRDTPPGIDLQRLPSGLKTKGDPEWMRIAIRNVLDNALKYSSDSGKPVEVSGTKKDDEVQISIEDKGVGIPADELGRVFEPFHRVDRSRTKATGGFGLGLHLTKKALEAQGAKIELKSEPQQGTTALLRFKIA